VKLGQAEAEVEADQEHLRDTIDLVPELAAKLPRAEKGVTDDMNTRLVPETTGHSSPHDDGDLPTINLEKGDSLADVIGKFFADSWGRERRKLSDVREALQSYGMNYPKQSVAVALLRLAKATRIRRFKAEDGEYVYTTSSFTTPQIQRQEEFLDEVEVAHTD